MEIEFVFTPKLHLSGILARIMDNIGVFINLFWNVFITGIYWFAFVFVGEDRGFYFFRGVLAVGIFVICTIFQLKSEIYLQDDIIVL